MNHSNELDVIVTSFDQIPVKTNINVRFYHKLDSTMAFSLHKIKYFTAELNKKNVNSSTILIEVTSLVLENTIDKFPDNYSASLTLDCWGSRGLMVRELDS